MAFDRIKYFSRVIQALAAADGANEYTILISIDGYNKTDFEGFKYLPNFEKYSNLIEIAKKYQENVELTGFPFKQVEVRIASTNLGYAKNKRQALEWGFEKSDYVIFIEDDIVVAPDALRWFESHYQNGVIHNDERLALVSCYGYAFPQTIRENDLPTHLLDLGLVEELGLLDVYHPHNWHTPWGWATWRSVWDKLQLKNWSGNVIDLGQIIREKKMYEFLPVVGRCDNVGSHGVNMIINLSHPQVIHKKQTYSAHYPMSRLSKCKYRFLPGPFSQLRMGLNHIPYPPKTTILTLRKKIPEDQKKLAKLTTC